MIHSLLQFCFSGDGGTPPAVCLLSQGFCPVYYFDGDFDGDIDLADHAAFAECYSGDGVTPPSACCQPTRYYHDADGDRDVDLVDWASLMKCVGTDAQASPFCVYTHDFDDTESADGKVDGSDHAGFWSCFAGPRQSPPEFCARDINPTKGPREEDEPPPSGTFALHGRPIDVLSDGHVLIYIRNRYYDPKHSRWLQRDPTGYADGANLYESFAGNTTTFTDPLGLQGFDPTQVGFFGASAENCQRAKAAAEAAWTAKMYGATEVEAGQVAESIYRPKQYIIRPANFALESKGVVLALLGGDANTADPWVLDYRLENELTHLHGALLLLGATFNPGQHYTLRLAAPDLAAGFTSRDRWELGVLGPLQGTAFAAEGVLDIGVDLANLGVDVTVPRGLIRVVAPEFDFSIPKVRFAEGLFLETTPRTAAASRFIGGESIVFLATLGVGEVALPARGVGEAARGTARARVWQFGDLPPGVLGATDEFGNITIRRGLRGQQLRQTVRHESVHAFLSPKEGSLFGRVRARVGFSAYEKSHLVQYIEEAAAEGYATGSLRCGLAFPIAEGYVNPYRVVGEGVIYIGGSAGAAYYVNRNTDAYIEP